MPPKRATTARSSGARVTASREVVAESTHVATNQNNDQSAAQQIDLEAIRQVAQEAAREAAQVVVQQVAHEAARVAAQEVARQISLQVEQAAAQQAQQVEVPPEPDVGHAALMEEVLRYRERFRDQLQEEAVEGALRGVRIQHNAPPVVAPEPVLPPPPPIRHYEGPTYWELMRQLRDMGLEMFGGSVDTTTSDNWKRKLERNLEYMRCPAEHRLDLATQYLKDDALVWWEGVVEGNRGYHELTYDDFKREFTRKFFPREAMDEKENAFQDIRQGSRTVREYELEFSRLRRFAGRVMDEQELIRRFMKGLRIEIRNRCTLRDYHSMVELVEKAAIQETGLAEEQRLNKVMQPKPGRTQETQKRTWGQMTSPKCFRCHRHHYGECYKCHICGQLGHVAKNCSNKPGNTVRTCFKCGELGHLLKDCPKLLPGPPPKRQVIAPRVFTVGDHEGVEPITGICYSLFSFTFDLMLCLFLCLVQ